MVDLLSAKVLSDIASSPQRAEEYSTAAGCPMVVVDLRQTNQTLHTPHRPATVIVALGDDASGTADLVLTSEDTLESIAAAISNQPAASYTLTQVLRHNETASYTDGLLTESLAYSALQHSSGFKNWLAARAPAETKDEPDEPLLVDRQGDTLTLTLNRPAAHNAYSAALKDALCAGLQVAVSDTSIKTVALRGNGPSFSAGGDLTEFGAAEDAGVAHVSRTTRSAAQLLCSLTCETRAHLHGACIGAGIELPAFTGHISAHPDTFFQLPEVAMGLIPGAGGTVSVLRRIGRQRTALMAISNQRIDAATALSWGLIDAISA